MGNGEFESSPGRNNELYFQFSFLSNMKKDSTILWDMFCIIVSASIVFFGISYLLKLPPANEKITVTGTAVQLIERTGKSSSSVYGIYQLDTGKRIDINLDPVGQSLFKEGNKYELSIEAGVINPNLERDSPLLSVTVFVSVFFSFIVMVAFTWGVLVEMVKSK
jgi:hypothetical protein